MTNLPRKKISTSKKCDEITRFIKFLNIKGFNAKDLASSIDVSDRTITNHLWGNTRLGAHLLRELLRVHGVSINWLVSGIGQMFVSTNDDEGEGEMSELTDVNEFPAEEDDDRPLIRYLSLVDLDTLQDYWWLTAKCAEQSMIRSGAVPGKDYSILECYQLAQPMVLHKFKKTDLQPVVFED